MAKKSKNTNPLTMSSFDFINQIEINTADRDRDIDNIIARLDDFILFPGQAIYMFDYDKKDIIYSRGIEQILGYTKDEFNFELIIDYIHPNQKRLTNLIMNTLVSVGRTGVFSQNDQYNILFKVRHKEGHYMPIFRQAKVIEQDDKGKMLSNISLVTDFTDMDDGNVVKWKLTADEKIEKFFKNALNKAINNVFTKQELKVLDKLKNGESSKIVADKLNISKHTVDTHRRNMIKKAEVKNTAELINFVYNNQMK